MREPATLLADYVRAHNHGVRTADFRALGELLLPTATLRFHGIGVGPFDGATAVLQAFCDQPPDDELTVGPCRDFEANTVEAAYGWARAPGQSAGRLRITAQRDRISAIRVEVFTERRT